MVPSAMGLGSHSIKARAMCQESDLDQGGKFDPLVRGLLLLGPAGALSGSLFLGLSVLLSKILNEIGVNPGWSRTQRRHNSAQVLRPQGVPLCLH